MPDDALLVRLRDAATATDDYPGFAAAWFSPEQVARGLERMRNAPCCEDGDGDLLRPSCNACWAAMLDAFLEGVRDG